MNRELAVAMARRIANLRGDAAIPSEDIIDLAQVCCFLLDVESVEDHAAKDCWLAGNDGHLQCTPPAVCLVMVGENQVCGKPANDPIHNKLRASIGHIFEGRKSKL